MQGVGKVVSYTNADRILPRELLDAIQQYADGVYLYICLLYTSDAADEL